MALNWENIEADEEFRNLPHEEKAKLKRAYIKQVFVPKESKALSEEEKGRRVKSIMRSGLPDAAPSKPQIQPAKGSVIREGLTHGPLRAIEEAAKPKPKTQSFSQYPDVLGDVANTILRGKPGNFVAEAADATADAMLGGLYGLMGKNSKQIQAATERREAFDKQFYHQPKTKAGQIAQGATNFTQDLILGYGPIGKALSKAPTIAKIASKPARVAVEAAASGAAVAPVRAAAESYNETGKVSGKRVVKDTAIEAIGGGVLGYAGAKAAPHVVAKAKEALPYLREMASELTGHVPMEARVAVVRGAVANNINGTKLKPKIDGVPPKAQGFEDVPHHPDGPNPLAIPSMNSHPIYPMAQKKQAQLRHQMNDLPRESDAYKALKAKHDELESFKQHAAEQHWYEDLTPYQRRRYAEAEDGFEAASRRQHEAYTKPDPDMSEIDAAEEALEAAMKEWRQLPREPHMLPLNELPRHNKQSYIDEALGRTEPQGRTGPFPEEPPLRQRNQGIPVDAELEMPLSPSRGVGDATTYSQILGAIDEQMRAFDADGLRGSLAAFRQLAEQTPPAEATGDLLRVRDQLGEIWAQNAGSPGNQRFIKGMLDDFNAVIDDLRGIDLNAKQPGRDAVSVNPPKRMRPQTAYAPEETPVTYERATPQAKATPGVLDEVLERNLEELDLKFPDPADMPPHIAQFRQELVDLLESRSKLPGESPIPGMPPRAEGRVEKSAQQFDEPAQQFDEPGISPKDASRYDFPEGSAKEGQPPMPQLNRPKGTTGKPSVPDDHPKAEQIHRLNEAIQLHEQRLAQLEQQYEATGNEQLRGMADQFKAFIKQLQEERAKLYLDEGPDLPGQEGQAMFPFPRPQSNHNPGLNDLGRELLGGRGRDAIDTSGLADNQVEMLNEFATRIQARPRLAQGPSNVPIDPRELDLSRASKRQLHNGQSPDELRSQFQQLAIQHEAALRSLRTGKDASGRALSQEEVASVRHQADRMMKDLAQLDKLIHPTRNPANAEKALARSAYQQHGFDDDYWLGQAESNRGGLTEKARFELQGILSRGQLAQQAGNASAVSQAKHDLYDWWTANRRTGVGDWVSGAWKAGLLASARMLGRNAVSTGFFQVLKQATKVPASMVDMWLQTHTGRVMVEGMNGRRALQSAVEGAEKGWREARQILKHGATPQRIQQLDMPRELNTFGNEGAAHKILDMPINYVFRAVAAADRPFWWAAYQGSLKEQARLIARAMSRGDDRFFQDYYAMAMDDAMLQANALYSAMEARAAHAGNVNTFNQHNALADAITRGAEANPGVRVAAETVMPFRKVPLNVAEEVLDYAVVGLAWKAAFSSRTRAVVGGQLSRQGREQARAILGALTPEEQKMVAELAGKGMVGASLMMLGFAAYHKGLASGMYDRTKTTLDKTDGRTSGGVKIGGLWVGVDDLTPAASVFALGATLAESMSNKQEDPMGAATQFAGKLASVHPMAESTREFAGLISDTGSSLPRFAGNLATRPIPAGLGHIAEATDDVRRDLRGDPRGNRAIESLKTSAMNKVPGLRQKMEAERDLFGRTVPSNRARGISPFSYSTDRSDFMTREMRKQGASPSRLQPEISDQKLPPKIHTFYQQLAGAYVQEELMQALGDADYYAHPTREGKLEVIREAIRKGRERARQEVDESFGFSDLNDVLREAR